MIQAIRTGGFFAQVKPDPTIEERIAALEKESGDLKAASARAALVDSVAKTG